MLGMKDVTVPPDQGVTEVGVGKLITGQYILIGRRRVSDRVMLIQIDTDLVGLVYEDLKYAFETGDDALINSHLDEAEDRGQEFVIDAACWLETMMDYGAIEKKGDPLLIWKCEHGAYMAKVMP